ncbi:uncharacterized protein BDW47DRAFT_108377 [Aspergillus candidus]|uniref:Carrier domain-containing protein n=1 Tax=Aspergillus candidus TaxID=41067 RepID=A0A2I2F7C7_ASPCN|nr:hypothetical protein BDW47DRAFT_108377 [Aspergillus candidus]PLB36533.1 hypothetical protein BDW47DRAFT_108377 [Aspergillus candidus]
MAARPSATLELRNGGQHGPDSQFAHCSPQPPVAVNACVHELIDKRCDQSPEAPAVCACDGNFTYRELQRHATALGRLLLTRGVGPEVIVPLCFHKSRWTLVAVLGVLHAGGAFVLLDPSHPMQRLELICQTVNAELILASPETASRAKDLATEVVVVHEGLETENEAMSDGRIASGVTPTNAAYAMFTSGTTGKPKGVVIEHRSISTSCVAHGAATTLTQTSRVLQFASYAFDACLLEVLTPLVHGACVCILSEEERRGDLVGALRRYGVNTAFLTPSVARSLDPIDLPMLKTVIFTGEAMNQNDIDRWTPQVDSINAYGPAECAILSCITNIRRPTDIPTVIGRAVGGSCWVVDENNVEVLRPVGEIGELLIEGPIVGRGYIGNRQSTAAAFVSRPQWLKELWPEVTGHVYRTGDLARCHNDGLIECLGRKDSQLKLNGQRMEAAEIEHHLQQHLPTGNLAVDIIQPKDDPDSHLLAAFVAVERMGGMGTEVHLTGASDEFRELTRTVQGKLHEKLPRYMVPSIFLPVSQMPLSINGKLNRGFLRQLGNSKTRQELQQSKLEAPVKRSTRNPAEKIIQCLWADVLQIPANEIGIDDNFWELGGSSIRAMRLAALVLRKGFKLTVHDIWTSASLKEMAASLRGHSPLAGDCSSFALCGNASQREELMETLVRYDIQRSEVEDVYPCTQLQQGLFSQTAKRFGAYTLIHRFTLMMNVDLERFRHAWEKTIEANPILRTRIIPSKTSGFWQAVIQGQIPWETREIDDKIPEQWRDWKMGERLVRLALSHSNSPHCPVFFTLVIHHALIEDWALHLILQQANAAYNGQTLERRPFSHFVQFLDSQSQAELENHWRRRLTDPNATAFPKLPSPRYIPVPTASTTFNIHLPLQRFGRQSNVPSKVMLAWGLLVAHYTGNWDVVFGLTVAGRGASIQGIESMTGPTIATIPMRLLLNPRATVADSLRRIQTQSAEDMPFEQIGLQRTSQLDPKYTIYNEFQSHLVIQPDESEYTLPPLFSGHLEETKLSDVSSYAINMSIKQSTSALNLSVTFDPAVVEETQINRMISQFDHILHQLHHKYDDQIGNIQAISPSDMKELREWNGQQWNPIDQCAPELIYQRSLNQLDAPAICAWDGDFTYRELETYAEHLAKRLACLGVKPESFVALCFEKSRWVNVAILAVMKAGGAFSLLDSSFPMDRLRQICGQLQASVIVCSTAKTSVARNLGIGEVVAVGSNETEWMSTCQKQPLIPPSPDNTMYVVFTSGSTGNPKGVVMTYGSWYSGAKAYCQKIRLNQHSRVLQFSGYAFDASVSDSVLPLIVGGCICIPSESDRISNLPGTITALRANWVLLTPSIARILSPESVPSLQTLVLGGETMTSGDIEQWSPYLHLIQVYAPAECAVIMCVQEMRKGTTPTNIGKSFGSTGWIIDPDDSTRLSPVGAVGELLVEGPVIARGYLNEPHKSEAFIENPPWLHTFRNAPCRLYKTGDLVQYTASGEFSIVGRKDTQIKLRGQRVEIAEVEHHLRCCFPHADQVAVELILAQASGDPLLAGFICETSVESESIFQADNEGFRAAVAIALSQLEAALPTFMVPAVLIPVNSLPISATGKLNRRELRARASELGAEQLDTFRMAERRPFREPTTQMQRKLQRAFAEVLSLPQNEVSIDDHFFRRGGDSLSAMRLVALVREAGCTLSVGDVFTRPRIVDLAENMGFQKNTPVDEPLPFSLGPDPELRQHILTALLEQSDLSHDQIEDLYPCTPMQEGLMALSLKDPGKYVAQFVYEFVPGTDEARFRAAIDTTVAANPILRTRLAQGSTGSFQVVVRDLPRWEVYGSQQEYERNYQTPVMGPNACLMQPTLIKHPPRFVLTIHHALYDGWTLPLLWDQIDAAYGGQQLVRQPFSSFISYLQQVEDSTAFWADVFNGLNVAIFPSLPSPAYNPQANLAVGREIPLTPRANMDFTLTIAIQLAWGIILSYYTDSDDLVYGLTLSGRSAPVFGIERFTGPTMTTVPFRMQLDPSQSIQHHVTWIQQKLAAMMLHEQTGLRKIQSASDDAARACQFQNQLIIQPPAGSKRTGPATEVKSQDENYRAFASYGIVVICNLPKDQDRPLEITALYDKTMMDHSTMKRMVEQFECVLRQIVSSPSDVAVQDVSPLSPSDWQQLAGWNAMLPSTKERCLHKLVGDSCASQPEKVAVSAWDGNFTFGEVASWSSRIASFLVARGLREASVVPVCLERSKWSIVTMLAVLRTGATVVCVDCNLPPARVRDIVDQVKPQMIIASTDTMKTFEGCAVTVLTVPFEDLPPDHQSISVNVEPASLAFILFTSGSSGRPKGIMMEHRQISTGIRDHSGPLNITSSSRALHFASYAFDLILAEIFTTLVMGGTVCVPSEADRMNGLERFIAEKQVNWAILTPSMLGILDPGRVPSLQTVVSAGEAMSRSVAQRWAPCVMLINGYGPAETTVVCAAGQVIQQFSDRADGTIGRVHGGAGWVTVPSDPTRLAPLGAVGELLIEGPAVTRGYLNNSEATTAAFIDAPEWLVRWRQGKPCRLYRTGDLVALNDDGSIRYIGRRDTQVKLRGQRIELGEIEHHVNQYTGGGTGVVDVANVAGSSVLFACIIHGHKLPSHLLEGSGAAWELFELPTDAFRETARTLHHRLCESLPSYMVPSLLLPLRSVPTTASGKTDRCRIQEAVEALSLSDMQAYASTAPPVRRQPTSPEEAAIQQVWASVLNTALEAVGVDDSFLSVGGDSISAMQLVMQLNSIGIRTTVQAIFQQKTIARLATTVVDTPKAVTSERTVYTPFSLSPTRYYSELDTLLQSALPQSGLSSTDVEDLYPLSPIQQGMLISQSRANDVYNNRFFLMVTANGDSHTVAADRLVAAWHQVVTRHPMLRSCIVPNNLSSGADLQLVHRTIPRTMITTILPPRPDPMAALQHTRHTTAAHDGQPPHHLTLCPSSQKGEIGLLLEISHLLTDGASFGILLRDLIDAYDGRLPIGALASYSTYVAYWQSLSMTVNQTYWTDYLHDIPTCLMPASKVISPPVSGGRSLRSIKVDLGSTSDLRRLSTNHDVTLATLIHVAWGLVLRSYTGSDEICFGYANSGRDVADVPGIVDAVGPFVTILVCRMRLTPGNNIHALARLVQEDLIRNAHHQHVALGDIYRDVGRSNMPLFNTVLSFTNQKPVRQDGSILLKMVSEDGANEYDLNAGVVVGEHQISITLDYWSSFLSDQQATMIMDTFEHTIHQLEADIPERTIGQMGMLGPAGRRFIEASNRHLPPPGVNCRVHDLVSQRCRAQPDALAVCSHDGKLTYEALETLALDLAQHLARDYGIGPTMFVPICCEKSHWVVISILAILKTGAAFVLMDPTHPRERLEDICRQVKAPLVMVSKAQMVKAETLAPRSLVIGGPDAAWSTAEVTPIMKTVSPEDPAYVIFTSGSTGRAKGVVISHSNMCTNATTNGSHIGIKPFSRVLQFSSYAFDASVLELLFTLLAGGCICIPSDAERVGDLEGAINRLEANWACLTPSVARVIEPTKVPSIRTLLLVGESVAPGDVTKWKPFVELHVGYGPAECAIISTARPRLQDVNDVTNIGHAFGSAAWITDAADPSVLAPVGAVGELIIEGPIVSTTGYLDTSDTSAQDAFIPPPAWLGQVCAQDGREPGCLYRTGDLVQYEPADGSMRYIGRRDTQVKLRGQRIELAEIEFHLRRGFPSANIDVVADVLSIRQRPSMLVAFVSEPQKISGLTIEEDGLIGVCDASFQRAITAAVRHLDQVLPVFMVPSTFIPVRRIPLSHTGKVDRRSLRAVAEGLSENFLNGCMAISEESTTEDLPITPAEHAFQLLFADVFNLENVKSIRRDDHFFRLGGDSILAMALIPKAREAGYVITMADCFQHPRLRDLAQAARLTHKGPTHDAVRPFALIPNAGSSDLARFAATCCGVPIADVQDIYPCTPMQEGLMALSTKSTRTVNPYVVTFRYNLDSHVDLDRFQAAWGATAAANPILRTRMIQSDHPPGTWQVVIAKSPQFRHFNSRVEHSRYLEAQPWGLGERLVELALVNSGPNGAVQFHLTIHHAVYDGWSIPALWRQVIQSYHEPSTPLLPRSLSPFIQYVQRQLEEAAAHWRAEFSHLHAPVWPTLPLTQRGRAAPTYCSIRRTLANSISGTGLEFTTTSVVHLAWALLMSCYTDSDDVVFGAILNGRRAPVVGIEDMTGPAITTLPLRVRLGLNTDTVAESLSTIQAQAVTRIPFEQFGLQNIRHLSSEADQACQFQCHLGIQTSHLTSDVQEGSNLFELIDSDYDNLVAFSEYALMVICHLDAADKSTVTVEINYNELVVSPVMAGTILGQFSHLLQQLPRNLQTPLSQLDLVSDEDRRQLHEWNHSVPPSHDVCLHDFVLRHTVTTPNATAVSAWDGDLTYAQLDVLSQDMASQLRYLGVRSGSLVPLCMQKSKWAVITMLSVLRAGGACVLLDAGHPVEYIKSIIGRVQANLVLTSPATRHLIQVKSDIRVETVPLQSPESAAADSSWLPPSCNDTAFVIFTSGSTGQPKGILMEHSHLCTSIRAHTPGMEITSSSRTLHFASYAFDASIYELFTTLCNGGCVCIPSDTDRLSNLASYIRAANVTYAIMAPSLVNRLLRPDEVPNLEVVSLGGEAVTQDIVDTWTGRFTVVNGYGPAEATICAVSRIDPANWPVGKIGPVTGGVGWITTPSDVSRLAPIGAVGELLIEGPIVTRGYLNDPERTAAAYIPAPDWLADIRGLGPGDHNKIRLYRTGDLMQYTNDGGIKFVGRKDTQIKLRGQRVELAQVEHNVRMYFSDASEVVAETVLRDGVPVLIAFIAKHLHECDMPHTDTLISTPSAMFREQAQNATARLKETLPVYMVPSVFLELARVPRTASDKLDRRRLRDYVARLSLDQFRAFSLNPSEKGPSREMTHREHLFQELWAEVLSVPLDNIGPDDDFFNMGGDSIRAMRLTSLLRPRGLALTVPDIFSWPTLSQQAREAKEFSNHGGDALYRPGSLVGIDSEELETFAAAQLAPFLGSPATVRPSDVEDMFPVTEFQRRFLEPVEVQYMQLTLPPDLDKDRLVGACRAMLDRHPILHSAFVPDQQGDGYLQALLRRPEHDFTLYTINTDGTQDFEAFIHRFCLEDAAKGVPWGAPVFRAVLVSRSVGVSSCDPAAALLLRISHAQYDGQSYHFILRDLASAYDGDAASDQVLSPPSFPAYLQYRQAQASTRTFRFWTEYLQDAEMTPLDLPIPTKTTSMETCQSCDGSGVAIYNKTIPMPTTPNGITISSLIKAAWAIVLSQVTGRSDIVFGHVLNGRDVPLEGAHAISGPCVTVSPIRIKVPQGSSSHVSNFLKHAQHQYMHAMPYANIDFELIRQHATSWAANTSFNSLVTHQNDGDIRTDIDFAGHQCPFRIRLVGGTPVCHVVTMPLAHPMLKGEENQGQGQVQGQAQLGVRLVISKGRITSAAMEGLLERLCSVVGDLGCGVFPDLERVGSCLG